LSQNAKRPDNSRLFYDEDVKEYYEILNEHNSWWPNDRLEVVYAYNSKAKNDSISNQIFSFENSKKAINGQIQGLKDPYPLLEIAHLAKIRYKLASGKYDTIQNKLFAYRNMLGSLLYKVYGTSISPDATSSLRISDGIVKGYAYNGTIAPPQTTFYRMYNRFYSFNKQYPWNLPKRWQNPPSELLPVPLDFVTTNNIIGGNSGSPIIKRITFKNFFILK
jgi:Peptidase S46